MELTSLPAFEELEVGNAVRISRRVRDGDLRYLTEVQGGGTGTPAVESFTSWIWLVYVAKFLPVLAPSLLSVRRLLEADFGAPPDAGSPVVIEVRVKGLEPIDAETGLVTCTLEASDGERSVGTGTVECVWRRRPSDSWWGDDETNLVAPPI